MVAPILPMLKYSIFHNFLNSPPILIKFVSEFIACKVLYLKAHSPLSPFNFHCFDLRMYMYTDFMEKSNFRTKTSFIVAKLLPRSNSSRLSSAKTTYEDNQCYIVLWPKAWANLLSKSFAGTCRIFDLSLKNIKCHSTVIILAFWFHHIKRLHTKFHFELDLWYSYVFLYWLFVSTFSSLTSIGSIKSSVESFSHTKVLGSKVGQY